MRRVNEIIIVEGKYDKNTVMQAVDGTVIETSGFGIFKDKEKLALLRELAKKRGLVILTDNDRAGFFIRGRLRGMLDRLNIKHAYVPDLNGKDRRKKKASKEGKLGVESMSRELIINALERAGVTFTEETHSSPSAEPITRPDLYEAGLYGRECSAQKRRELMKQLELPVRLSTGGLLEILNVLFTRKEFFQKMDQFNIK